MRQLTDDEDWWGRDLSGMVGSEAVFRATDLSETTSTGGTVLTGCTFRDVRFNGAQYRDAAFVNCTFTGCNFFAAHFLDCKFTGSTFNRCSFGQLLVSGGDWSFVSLREADLRKVELRGVRMRESVLTGAQCEEAVLRDVDLSAAALDRVNFTGADLRGSDVSALDPAAAVLGRAVVDWRQAVVLVGNLGLDVREV